ncbi:MULTISPECIES: pitrilysin family protein [Myxococcus]|uniref:Insulinase family protein n=2 Tax=Myxococcaceae TaxID=31 RepID=A0A540WL66_9BACT|nr:MULTISPECIES: pitrilysin family protein [Myxococcus]NTX05940.1 insulinase family protein [Myxococcus sp. CA040A]NTX10551.1 insulinase family protein [Myxococcus sp. CA056]TQF09567.1 insulinase family protein [Myxococcus llanfairpwllgwyngyllgogerychwyrndrobwllllantysiliogogogochensis]
MKALVAAALVVFGLPALALSAQEAKPLEPGREAVAIPYEKYTLPNGLEVILSVDRKLPVVSVNVWYHVGAYHEQPGRTGFAHLFEHMMFQGSRNVADDVHISMLEQLGATDLNGTTSFDRTNYFETVPTHHLETALWLESDRMGFLLDALSPEKLATQREVVKNERRQGTETAPYGLAREAAWHALFPLPHPYHGDVIGSMKDLDAATPEDVKDFFRKWYAPSNATLAVVGDFDVAKTKALIEKYFGSLPSHPKPTKPEVASVKLAQPVVIRHEERVATLPLLSIQWLSPGYFEDGDATADVLATALGTGKASRLYRRLVLDKQLAQSVNVTQQSQGAQSVFTLDVVARPGVSTDALLKEVDAVLEDIRRNGITPEEIQRARTRYDTRTLAGLQSIGGFGGKADVLQNYNHFVGEPSYVAQDLARYETVTPESVKLFARDTLRPDARVILHAVPPARKQAPVEPKERH